MISQANISVLDTLRKFKAQDIPVTFIVPTKTGLTKSIMDATGEIREFLKSKRLHDYNTQSQGKENKVIIPAKILSNDTLINTKCSLYRPNTKQGDPRIWIYSLTKLAEPSDLLALISTNEGLLIINCSKTDLQSLLRPSNQLYRDLLSYSVVGQSPIAKELLGKIQDIHNMGFIQTMKAGDTGIGFTLESLLGIKSNSSKSPDYKGIELKSSRTRSARSGRSTIFSLVPNWSISNVKSTKELLYKRGRYSNSKQRIQLIHQLSMTKPNSYDLKLDIDRSKDQLQQLYVPKGSSCVDVLWDFDLLKERLAAKHKETFWVSAQTNGRSGDPNEEYRYSKIKHTSSLDTSAFPVLIELGVITLDYTIKEKSPGKPKDQGYLFKMATKDLDLLFNKVEEYDLSI